MESLTITNKEHMKDYINQLDKFLTEYLVVKAPALPKNAKEFLVKAAPYFAILAVILGIPAFLAIFGFGAILTPFAFMAGARTGAFWFFWLVGVAQVVLAGMSIKPLFAREGHGWRLMLYSELISIVSGLRYFNLGSLVITILSLYLLYQVKSSFKK